RLVVRQVDCGADHGPFILCHTGLCQRDREPAVRDIVRALHEARPRSRELEDQAQELRLEIEIDLRRRSLGLAGVARDVLRASERTALLRAQKKDLEPLGWK